MLFLAESLQECGEKIDRIERLGCAVEMVVEALREKVERLEEVIKNDRKTD